MPGINVSILLHGLFFMTQDGNNLRVYAPEVPNHHFIGGIRGSRKELTDVQDLMGLGLQGSPAPPNPNADIDGTVMRFPTSDVKGFRAFDDRSLFRGGILLPWPIKIIGLRTGDIGTTFIAQPGTSGQRIKANAGAKGSLELGVVALLQYTLPAIPSVGGISQVNIHYYLQPSFEEDLNGVNADLTTVRTCFLQKGFDLLMRTNAPQPTPVDPNGNLGYGTTVEDEQSVHEERDESPDIEDICKNDPPPPPPPPPPPGAPEIPAVNPANCPVFFVG